ncbi:leucine-rich repeat domain-containing protein [Pseudohalioglobus sediminis]|uniref:Leucine-rich repeat domain-containing protein n=1 Tax=Pseudohalioglobus sediminis TaxID=2606449 RepID=A0A5B0X5N0_9GAMM|nr:leucine-rich repeat domain-containing protein [Pseudohalioglobus sediminis]KAA1193985.1 leucine-rich repeat domain-containing protein [Pseudohalioglobus sediminis]
MSRYLTSIAVLLTSLTQLSGCWIEVSVPSGGDVTGGSSGYYCESGQTCAIEVADMRFSATFEARPWAGWVFMGWRQDWKYLCGGSQETCTLSTDNPYFPEDPRLVKLIESDEVFYLQPVFVRGTPTETAIAAVADPALRVCLRTVVDDIRDVAYAEELPRLECGNLQSLQGLEVFQGLERLELDDFENELIDLSPLQALVRLRTLALVGNGDDDTFRDTSHLGEQLTAMPDLESLDLSRNAIDDLSPLAVALAQLKRLTQLNLFANQISDLRPLSALHKLTSLNLLGNQIEDIGPLAAMTRLRFLELSGNSITDLRPLAELKELTTLNTIGSPIDDISPLQGLQQLQFLNLSGGNIDNLAPLQSLTALEVLRLKRNQISEVDSLAGLNRLTWIELAGNAIEDIGGLADLTRVEYLDLGENALRDLGPLAGMIGLQELNLNQNRIVDVGPLAGLDNLRELSLGGNEIVDVSPLTDLAGLDFLDLRENAISEVGDLANSLSPGAILLLSGNPLSCGEIDRLLSEKQLSVVYHPLPAECT